MDLKFRSLNEAERFVEELRLSILDLEQLLKQQRQQVKASVIAQLKVLAETFKLVTTKPSNEVNKLDIDKKIKIPGGVKQLQVNYQLLQELIQKEEELTTTQTVVLLTFKDEVKTKPLIEIIEQLKLKIAQDKENIISFLNEIATSTVPPSFNKYVFSTAQSVTDHVSLTEDQYDVYYYLTTIDSTLLYSAFIELKNIHNTEDELINQLYLSIHWCVGSDKVSPQIKLALSYQYVDPIQLFKESNLVVTSINECVQACDKLLEAEGFVVNVADQPIDKRIGDQINLNSFNLNGKISQLEVEPDRIIVTLTKVPKSDLESVKAQVYLGIMRLFVRGTKLKMESKSSTLTFNVLNYSQGKKFTPEDIAYFENWGLTEKQLKKIELILQ